MTTEGNWRELVAKGREAARTLSERRYAPLLDHLATALERLGEALEQIAAFDDRAANERLKYVGSWGGFDEPGSVQVARQALHPRGEGEDV